MARWDRGGNANIPDWFWQAVETEAAEHRVEVKNATSSTGSGRALPPLHPCC